MQPKEALKRSVQLAVLTGVLLSTAGEASAQTAQDNSKPQSGNSLLLPPQPLSVEPAHQLSEIFTVHGVPVIGGPIDPGRADADYKALGIKNSVEVEPSETWWGKGRDAKRSVVFRFMFSNNKVEKDVTKQDRLIRTARWFGQSFPDGKILLFNEVNSTKETEGKPLSPEDHAIDFENSVAILRRNGFTGDVLLTPLQQGNAYMGLGDMDYLTRLLTQLKKDNFDLHGVAVHDYMDSTGKDPFERIQAVDDLIKRVWGKKLDLYVTEAGIGGTTDQISSDIERLMRTPIPDNLVKNLRMFAWWEYSNFDQRRPDDQNDPVAQSFEGTALVQLNKGPTEIFRKIVKVKQAA